MAFKEFVMQFRVLNGIRAKINYRDLMNMEHLTMTLAFGQSNLIQPCSISSCSCRQMELNGWLWTKNKWLVGIQILMTLRSLNIM